MALAMRILSNALVGEGARESWVKKLDRDAAEVAH
jgi:hypothetical protein